jgi:uncharacterized membrane protein YtjA (UPF0391 family)
VKHPAILELCRTPDVPYYWAIVFLVVALIAAFLGFGGVAGVATEGARMLFWIAIILVMLSFIDGMLRRG